MMWKEFELIAGYKVSFEDYNDYIEPMYMAVGDTVTKQEFVKMIDRSRFALPEPKELLKKVRKQARYLYAICGFKTDNESKKQMKKAADQYAELKYGIKPTDVNARCFFIYGNLKPGVSKCTYPKELVIGRDGLVLERVRLQRN